MKLNFVAYRHLTKKRMFVYRKGQMPVRDRIPKHMRTNLVYRHVKAVEPCMSMILSD